MLGTTRTEERRKVYLNIKDGAIIRRTPIGEERYSYVEGRLEAITTKERTFRNEIVKYWYIDLRDTENGELYSLGFSFSSNVYKSIILSLSSDDTLSKDNIVRIEPYVRNGYDKVVVWNNGVKLDWIVKTLPPLEDAIIGGRIVRDDTKRMEYICSLTSDIVSKIG
jgi:hypothetical protein